MYLRLEKWGNKHWNILYANFPDLTHEEKKEIKQILTMPTKQGIKLSEDRLYDLGIVNGLGPWWFPNFLRRFFTWLFPFLDFFFHDLGYLLAESKEDRLNADRGWLKYAFVSIYSDSIKAEKRGNLLLLGYTYITSILKGTTAYIGYMLLRTFGSFSTNY